jgi:hypothetical protein
MTSFHRSLATITTLFALAGAGQVLAGNRPPARPGNSHPQVRQCVSDSARAVNTCLNHGRGAKCEKAVNQAIKSCEKTAAGKPGKK